VKNSLSRARRCLALDRLAEGESAHVVAADLGVSASTVYDWMRRPEFKAELDRRLDAGREAAIEHLRANGRLFAQTLIDIARSGGKEDGPRVKAAELGLALMGVVPTEHVEVTHHGDLRDSTEDDLEQRLAALNARHHRPAVEAPN
jgi:hypothetical protein